MRKGDLARVMWGGRVAFMGFSCAAVLIFTSREQLVRLSPSGVADRQGLVGV